MDTKKTIGSETWIDPDEIPPLTAEFFEKGEWRMGETVIRRGRPPTGLAKEQVSLRLAPDLVAKLRALGPGWQGKAAEALRQLVEPT